MAAKKATGSLFSFGKGGGKKAAAQFKTKLVVGVENEFETSETIPTALILPIRKFASGATRDTDVGKHDFEGYESIQVRRRYAEYMTANRLQKDGTIRESSNWKRGIAKDAYITSLDRHVVDVIAGYRGLPADDLEVSLCATIFNASGLLFELLAEKSGKRERHDQ